MGYYNDDPRLTQQGARELGYCENCNGCNATEDTEDEYD